MTKKMLYVGMEANFSNSLTSRQNENIGLAFFQHPNILLLGNRKGIWTEISLLYVTEVVLGIPATPGR